MQSVSTSAKEYAVLVYSHQQSVIEQIRNAIGEHPAPGQAIEYYSATDYDDVVAALDKYEIDLVIFDGEAQPMGGLGAARQMRDEFEAPPRSLVVVARDADQWLGAWSGADLILTHPLDPIETGRKVVELLSLCDRDEFSQGVNTQRGCRPSRHRITSISMSFADRSRRTTVEHTWQAVLSHLIAGEDLGSAAADWAMARIISGEADPAQLSAFAVLLRAKGESLEELNAIADRMYSEATPLTLPDMPTYVDIVGTGGDGSGSVNISTMAAIVVAAAGVPVVKHGNRAASSLCGSADLLEALGVKLEADPDFVQLSLREVGIAFCFARTFHPGMRHAAPVRQAIKVPTVFNLLGPLTNPSRPPAGVIGCADATKAPLLAGVFAKRGATVLVARGKDGLDEISTTAPTDLWLTDKSSGEVTARTFDARDFGIPRAVAAGWVGGDATHNARVARSVFSGEPGPVRDAVLVNAAAAIVAASAHDTGADLADEGVLHEAITVAMRRCAGAIEAGAAADLVDRWTKL